LVQLANGPNWTERLVERYGVQVQLTLNDNFTNAETLVGGFISVQGNNQNATNEPFEPDHAGQPGGHSLWYQWTALSTKPVTVDTI
jgi:hypothetical protein